MKPILLFATLSLVFATPAVHAKSELETLRALCREQERQIRQLEDENSKLRFDSGGSRQQRPTSAPILSAATRMETIANPTPSAAATYTVKAGDSLDRIARQVGTSPEKLAKSNGLKTSSIIQPGQKLNVPGAVAPVPAATSAPQPKPLTKTHTVKQGETFSSISRKHKISTATLIAANPKLKPTALRPGQILELSASAPSTPPTAQATPIAAPEPTPPPEPATAPTPITTKQPAAEETPAATTLDRKLHPVAVDAEMTYGDFAAKHGTNTERLNALNGLDLTEATVLAKGSELYIPAQP
jgi:LysM repeat protein